MGDLNVSSGSREVGAIVLGLEETGTTENFVGVLTKVLGAIEKSDVARLKLTVNDDEITKKIDEIVDKLKKLQDTKIVISTDNLQLTGNTNVSNQPTRSSYNSTTNELKSTVKQIQTLSKEYVKLSKNTDSAKQKSDQLGVSLSNILKAPLSDDYKSGALNSLKNIITELRDNAEKAKPVLDEATRTFNKLSAPNSTIGRESIIGKLWDESDRESLRELASELNAMTKNISQNGINSQSVEYLQNYIDKYTEYQKLLVDSRELTTLMVSESGMSWSTLSNQIRGTIEILKQYNTQGSKSLQSELESILADTKGNKAGSPEDIAQKYDAALTKVKRLILYEEARKRLAQEEAKAEKERIEAEAKAEEQRKKESQKLQEELSREREREALLAEEAARKAEESQRKSAKESAEVFIEAEKEKAKEAEETAKSLEKQSKAAEELQGKILHGTLFSIGATFVRYLTMEFRQIVKYVVEIDDALTQVAIVTNNSVKGLSDFANEAVDAAKRVGASVTDIMKSVETWARLGYSLSDSTNLAAVTSMYSNVANTSVEDATTSLTSILKGFNLSAGEAENVIDKLTLVGQKYAISASELGVALQKGGAALYAGGNSLDEAIALVTAANSAIQDASTVGTMMKTMSARIRASKTELEEMGEDLDGVASSASKMRAEILALSGVDIMIDSDTYKSTYQIMLELAKVWDDLTDVSRANLLEKIAGKRGASVVQSLITNIKDMEGAYVDSLNAMGTASKANETYLDSISGRMDILKTNIQQLAQAVFNSDLFKKTITFLSTLTEGLTKVASFGDSFIPKFLILSEALIRIVPIFTKYNGIIGLLSKMPIVYKLIVPIVDSIKYILSDGFKGIGANIQYLSKVMGISITQFTQLGIILTAIAAVIKVAQAYVGAYQNGVEKFDSVYQEYEKSNQTLDELKQKLADNEARIREIKSLGPIDIIEATEIAELETANAELKNNILLQEELSKSKKIEAQNQALKNAQKWANQASGSSTGGLLYSNQEALDNAIANANNPELGFYHDDLIAQAQKLLEIMTELQSAGVSEDDATYQYIQKQLDRATQALNPTQYISTKLSEIYGKEEFQDILAELRELDEVTADVLNEDKYADFRKALADVGIQAEDLDKVANTLNDDIKSANYSKAFDDLSESITGANDALNKFKNESGAEKDDPYKGFVDAEKKVIEEITNGRLYSNTFKSGASLLLGDDWLEKSAEEQAKQIKKIQKYFKFDDDSGLTFLDAMIDKSKELKKEWVTLDDDDNFVVNIKPDDYEEIAKAFGMSAEAVKVLVAAWGNYIELDPFHDDEIAKAFIENGVIMENGILNLKEAREVLSSMGMDDDRIEKTIDYIMQMGDASQKVDLSNIEDALEFFAGEDNDWGVMDNGVVDALNLLERMQRLSFSDTDIYDFLTALKESGDVSAANLDEALKRISETDLEKPKTEVEDVNTKIEDAIENAMKFRRITYQQGIESMDQYATSASKTADNFKTLVYWLDQVINLMPLAGGYRGVVSSTVFGGSEAEGTKSAPRGISLTGEEGPEIIYNAASHKSSIVGLNGPEFVRLQGGEVILNASDTKRVFGNSVGLSERYGSFVTGTGSLDILRKYGTHTSYYTGGTGGSSSGTADIKSLLKSSKDSADAAYDMAVAEIEKRVDALKDEEDALKDAADAAKDLADAEKDALKNEYDIAKEAIQDRIDTIEKEYDAAADGLDKEIERLKEQLTLLKETNEQEDKALKLQQAIDAYEAAKKAKTARVYTADKGWIWVADPDAVKNAKDTLDELYKEYARDDAEKAINDQIDAIEKQKDAMKEEADAQKQVLEDLSKAWAEQIEKMDYSVEEYQKYIETLTKYTEMSVGDMTESINEFGNQVAEVMQLNTEANNAKEAYDAFKEIADLEIEKLNELKKKWSEYKSHVSKTLEEYNEELNYASKYSVMSFDEMAQAAEDYMAKVKEIMKLNSQNAASKGYASGSTSIPSTGAKIVDEYGQELIVHKPDLGHYAWLEKGDGVVPADITRRLMALGTNPAAYLSAYAKSAYKGLSGVNTSTTNYNFGGDIVLNNVKDAKSFFTEFEQEINLRQTR